MYQYYISVRDTYSNLDIAWEFDRFDPFLPVLACQWSDEPMIEKYTYTAVTWTLVSAIGMSWALFQTPPGCRRLGRTTPPWRRNVLNARKIKYVRQIENIIIWLFKR